MPTKADAVTRQLVHVGRIDLGVIGVDGQVVITQVIHHDKEDVGFGHGRFSLPIAGVGIPFWAFGFFVALIFTFISMLYTFGVRHWLGMTLGAVVLALVFQALFMGIMRLNDPKGAIADLRPYTNWITGAQ